MDTKMASIFGHKNSLYFWTQKWPLFFYTKMASIFGHKNCLYFWTQKWPLFLDTKMASIFGQSRTKVLASRICNQLNSNYCSARKVQVRKSS
jgi:hypothetical protein